MRPSRPFIRIAETAGALVVAIALLAAPAQAADSRNPAAARTSSAANALICAGVHGSNPPREEIAAYLQALGQTNAVPPQLLKVIALKESSWQHFRNDGAVNESADHGIGLMQLTGATAREFNVLKLCSDWRYNAESGMKVLKGKIGTVESRMLGHLDLSLIENWVQATRLYNGSGPAADSYVAQALRWLSNPSEGAAWFPQYTTAQAVTAPQSVYSSYAWPLRVSASPDGAFRFYKDNQLVTTRTGAVHPWSVAASVFADDALAAVPWGADQVTLFGRNSDATVTHRVFTPSSATFPGTWSALTGSAAHGGPAVGRWPDGTTQIFSKSLNPRTLHRRVGTNAGGWQTQVPFATDADVKFSPAVVSAGQGLLQVFYVDTAGNLHTRGQSPAGWSPWTVLGIGFSSAPNAAVSQPDKILVMAANGANRLAKKVLTVSTGTWSDWSELTTPTLAPGSRPGIAVRPNGQLIVAVRGADNHLYKIVRDGTWGTWQDLGSTGAINLGSGPEVSAPDTSSIVIFGRTTTGGPMYTRWTSTTNWSPWAPTGQ